MSNPKRSHFEEYGLYLLGLLFACGLIFKFLEDDETINSKEISEAAELVKKAYKNEQYGFVVMLNEEHNLLKHVNDDEVKKYIAHSTDVMQKVENERRTKQILAELRKIPASEYDKNRKLYKELVILHPDNQLYQAKKEFYENKIEEEQKKKRELAKQREEAKQKEYENREWVNVEKYAILPANSIYCYKQRDLEDVERHLVNQNTMALQELIRKGKCVNNPRQMKVYVFHENKYYSNFMLPSNDQSGRTFRELLQ